MSFVHEKRFLEKRRGDNARRANCRSSPPSLQYRQPFYRCYSNEPACRASRASRDGALRARRLRGNNFQFFCSASRHRARIPRISRQRIFDIYGTRARRAPVRRVSAPILSVLANAPRLCRTHLHCLVETFLHNTPIKIREESINVVLLFSGYIVHHVGVFPEVERKQYRQSGELTDFVVANKDGMNLLCYWIAVHDSPADSATPRNLSYVRNKSGISIFFGNSRGER